MPLCECGCGTPTAPVSRSGRGRKVGEHPRFLKGHTLPHRTSDWVQRFWRYVDKSGDCWLWTGTRDANGYGRFYKSPAQRVTLAHRVSYELAHGPISGPLLFVCHRCDNPPCLNPAHLFLGTRAENVADACAKQRMATGERHGRGTAKLTPDLVLQIRAAYIPKRMGAKRLAKRFGVAPTCIRSVLSGRTWAHVTASPSEALPRP